MKSQIKWLQLVQSEFGQFEPSYVPPQLLALVSSQLLSNVMCCHCHLQQQPVIVAGHAI